MTDATTPETKREPRGAAVAGAHPRPKRYPAQLLLQISQETRDRIEADAAKHGLSMSEVGRTYLEVGIEVGEAEAAAEAAGRLAD